MNRRAYLATACVIILLGDILAAYCLYRAHISPLSTVIALGLFTLIAAWRTWSNAPE